MSHFAEAELESKVRPECKQLTLSHPYSIHTLDTADGPITGCSTCIHFLLSILRDLSLLSSPYARSAPLLCALKGFF